MKTMRSQRGFSLVELMIAMLLGALIVAAAVQLFGTNQRTFALQQSMTEVQEQGRFALDYIVRDLHRMSFVEAAPGTLPNYDDVGVMLTSTTIGGVAYPAAQEGGAAATANDRLTFAYFGSVDCEGDETAGGNVLIVNTYWTQNGDLVCQGSVDAGTTGLVLVSGVDSFQVLYGVDTTPGDEIALAGNYLRADQINVDHVVIAVKIGLLVRSNLDRNDIGAPESFVVLDHELAGGAAPLEQSLIRRLFTTTVRARNFDWEEI